MRKYLLVFSAMLIVGCGGEFDEPSPDSPSSTTTMGLNGQMSEAQRLFEEETFDGNGRTCASCHLAGTRTISPGEAQSLFEDNPHDPVFQHDAADGSGEECTAVDAASACSDTAEGVRCRTEVVDGTTYECKIGFTRFLQHATIQVGMNPAPNITVDGVSGAVTLHRGIPSTVNTAALDPVIMWDGRAPTLEAQAADAAGGHAQATTFTSQDLDLIAAFESSEFSTTELAEYADGGNAPRLPQGNTASEKRGRKFFIFTKSSGKEGLCATCHTGSMLNEVGGDFTLPLPGDSPSMAVDKGARFTTAFVSETNTMGNPVYTWNVTDSDGTVRSVRSPDIGRAAITGEWSDVNRFKIPTLWNIKNTAPYFHDNSAKDLDELADHYGDHVAPRFGKTLTEQDRADIVAYMKLL